MTVDEYERRRSLAEAAAGEPLFAWWQQHLQDCPANVGGGCNCVTDIWFSGFRWTVCVTPDFQALPHPIH